MAGGLGTISDYSPGFSMGRKLVGIAGLDKLRSAVSTSVSGEGARFEKSNVEDFTRLFPRGEMCHQVPSIKLQSFPSF